MKTPLMYGLLMAVVNAVLTFGEYSAGFHDTPEKLTSVQAVNIIVGLGAFIVILVFGIRGRRAEYPPEKPWGYGTAFGSGFLTGLFGSLFSTVVAYMYFAVINPQFSDVAYQLQVNKLEAKGLSADKIAAAEGMMRKFLSPTVLTIGQLVQAIVFTTLASLVIAAFFRNRSTSDTPPLPPPLT